MKMGTHFRSCFVYISIKKIKTTVPLKTTCGSLQQRVNLLDFHVKISNFLWENSLQPDFSLYK